MKYLHEFDQASKFLTDNIPSFLWTMYTNLKNEGFDEKQAMSIIDSYIFATFTPGE